MKHYILLAGNLPRNSMPRGSHYSAGQVDQPSGKPARVRALCKEELVGTAFAETTLAVPSWQPRQVNVELGSEPLSSRRGGLSSDLSGLTLPRHGPHPCYATPPALVASISCLCH